MVFSKEILSLQAEPQILEQELKKCQPEQSVPYTFLQSQAFATHILSIFFIHTHILSICRAFLS